MVEAKMLELDKYMLDTYGAARSIVTNESWVLAGSGIWLCAYCRAGKDEGHPPGLYLVHYSVEFDTTIVYKSIAVIPKEDRPWTPEEILAREG
jgi:hypothetical protein